MTNELGTLVYLYDAFAGTSHALLLACARDYAARRGIKDANLTLREAEGGKPFFPAQPQICFSVSHSAAYWLCAFSDVPVGADIQCMRPLDVMRFARRWYDEKERALVQRGGAEAFFDVWCAKEAYLKYTGRGLDWMRSNVDCASDDGVKRQINGVRCEAIQLPFVGYRARLCGGSGSVCVLDHRTGVYADR